MNRQQARAVDSLILHSNGEELLKIAGVALLKWCADEGCFGAEEINIDTPHAKLKLDLKVETK